MPALPVVKFPHPALAARTQPLLKVTSEDRALIRDMIDTMRAAGGVGLAANQIGVSKSIFVSSEDQVAGEENVFINPVILHKSGSITEFEGCLSIPRYSYPLKRYNRVRMKAMDIDWKPVEIEAEGLMARICQHEVDHLNGLLFIDHLGLVKSRWVRHQLLKKFKNQQA